MSETALEKAQARLREMREAGDMPERIDPLERSRRKPNSLRAAVTAKCWECMGGGEDPGTRRLITECASSSCPLHSVRPYQRNTQEDPA